MTGLVRKRFFLFRRFSTVRRSNPAAVRDAPCNRLLIVAKRFAGGFFFCSEGETAKMVTCSRRGYSLEGIVLVGSLNGATNCIVPIDRSESIYWPSGAINGRISGRNCGYLWLDIVVYLKVDCIPKKVRQCCYF